MCFLYDQYALTLVSVGGPLDADLPFGALFHCLVLQQGPQVCLLSTPLPSAPFSGSLHIRTIMLLLLLVVVVLLLLLWCMFG